MNPAPQTPASLKQIQFTLEQQFRDLHQLQKTILFAHQTVEKMDKSESQVKYAGDVKDLITKFNSECATLKEALEKYFLLERQERLPVHFQFRKIYRSLQ